MATIAGSPVNTSLPAADRVLELEVWLQFKAMLEHTQQSTPGLRSIAVSLDDQSRRFDPTILIVAEVDEVGPNAPGMADESAGWKWERWASQTFPPDVLRHFRMTAVPAGEAEPDGR